MAVKRILTQVYVRPIWESERYGLTTEIGFGYKTVIFPNNRYTYTVLLALADFRNPKSVSWCQNVLSPALYPYLTDFVSTTIVKARLNIIIDAHFMVCCSGDYACGANAHSKKWASMVHHFSDSLMAMALYIWHDVCKKAGIFCLSSTILNLGERDFYSLLRWILWN